MGAYEAWLIAGVARLYELRALDFPCLSATERRGSFLFSGGRAIARLYDIYAMSRQRNDDRVSLSVTHR